MAAPVSNLPQRVIGDVFCTQQLHLRGAKHVSNLESKILITCCEWCCLQGGQGIRTLTLGDLMQGFGQDHTGLAPLLHPVPSASQAPLVTMPLVTMHALLHPVPSASQPPLVTMPLVTIHALLHPALSASQPPLVAMPLVTMHALLHPVPSVSQSQILTSRPFLT